MVVPADGLVPLGTKPSAGTMMTKFDFKMASILGVDALLVI